MTIKNYKCKCGHNDFFFADKGNQKGIYCTYCGKWLKWADKDEQNLTLNQEPKSEWQHDHEILKAYSDGANEVLDKIRGEIEAKIEEEEFARSVFRHEEKDAVKAEQCTGSIMAYNNVIKFIDTYKAESEG